jgi:hypothetical protein
MGAYESDPSFHALHVVRIRGRAPIESVRAAVGRDDVLDLLRPLAGDGHVEYRTGRLPGWAVTATGRDHHAELLAREREAAGVHDDVTGEYERFLAINQTLIEVCSAFQVMPDGTLNDHTDAGYDAEVVDRLASVHDDAAPVCLALTGSMTRFTAYEARLGTALERVQSGETTWFTGLLVDSYHTVWFELHEDLLQTLGRDRQTEGSG